jgi:hypothetical protein
MGGAVEEREVGVTVELRVPRHGTAESIEHMFGVC